MWSQVAVTALVVAIAPRMGGADDEAPHGWRRWRVGLQAGVLELPRGHLGIPFDGTMEGYHLPVEVVVRWQWSRTTALNAGVGLPHAAGGITAWLGHEVSTTVARDRRGIAALAVYEDAGVALGFLGPDYYARHSDVFVGYLYGIGGPVGLGARLPIGVRVTWLDGAFDTYIEATSTLRLIPSMASVDALFDLGFGFHVRL